MQAAGSEQGNSILIAEHSQAVCDCLSRANIIALKPCNSPQNGEIDGYTGSIADFLCEDQGFLKNFSRPLVITLPQEDNSVKGKSNIYTPLVPHLAENCQALFNERDRPRVVLLHES